MKLKITISGPRVHGVGYRVFLLKHAMNLALPGLSTYNWDESGQQQVIALVEGDEARISAFLQTVEKNKPEPAEVSKVTSGDYDGDVGRAGEIAMFCTFVQLDKAIPLLLEIRDNTKATPQILEEIKGLREDVQPGYANNLRQVQADVRAIKERLGMRQSPHGARSFDRAKLCALLKDRSNFARSFRHQFFQCSEMAECHVSLLRGLVYDGVPPMGFKKQAIFGQ